MSEKEELPLHGDLERASFVLTDESLIIWSALFWCLGAATAYAVLVF